MYYESNWIKLKEEEQGNKIEKIFRNEKQKPIFMDFIIITIDIVKFEPV